MVDGALDGAGSKVVLEEFLTGFECSLLCFTDGKTIVPMVSAKDHKQIFDGIKDLIRVVWELFLQIHFYQKVWMKS